MKAGVYSWLEPIESMRRFLGFFLLGFWGVDFDLLERFQWFDLVNDYKINKLWSKVVVNQIRILNSFENDLEH